MFVLWKNETSFHNFWFYLQKLSYFWPKLFGKLVKNAIQVSKGRLWGKTKFSHFQQKKFGVWEKDFDWVVKFAFHVSMGTFWGTFCGEKNKKFFGFQILSEKFSYFWRKFSPGFSKQQFTSSVERFNEDLIFWEECFFNQFRTVTGNNFSFLAKKTFEGLSNCNGRV